jgi:transcriptional regulator with XRE-family HTH domain
VGVAAGAGAAASVEADHRHESAHDKHPREEQAFGPRLAAALRKAAGFTQHQLADELGISRRRIAYYEAESDHPPANLLADLARVLNLSTDQQLTDEPPKRQAKASLSPRLERRLKQIERLSQVQAATC